MIGRDLRSAGGSLCIMNKAPSGLLYLFVNDCWQTAANNCCGLRLAIEVVERLVPTFLFTLDALNSTTDSYREAKPDQ